MAKYICSECRGESDTPKVCETEGCVKNGLPLDEVGADEPMEMESGN